MPLKLVVDDINEINEGLRDLYTQNDAGKYVLEVDGAVPRERLDEFRSSNRSLKQQLDDLNDRIARFDGVDVEEYQALKQKADELNDKKLLEEGDVEKIVNDRVTKAVQKKDQEINNSKLTIENLTGQLERLLIDNQIKDVAIEAGVQESAIPDVVSRGRQAYRIMEGSAVAVDADGNKVYGDDGVTPLSMNEWMKGLRSQAAHLFKPSQGTEAPGSTRRTDQHQDAGDLSATDKISAGLAQRSRS